jgi:hypothetical protein
VPEPLAIDITSLDAKAVVETTRLSKATAWVFEHNVRRPAGPGHHAYCLFDVGCGCEELMRAFFEFEREAGHMSAPNQK